MAATDVTNLKCPIDGAGSTHVWADDYWRCELGHYLAVSIFDHGAVMRPVKTDRHAP